MTEQETKENAKPPAEEPVASEPSQEEGIKIPKQELDRVRKILKERDRELETVQKELEKLRSKEPQTKGDSKPEPGKPDDVAELRKQVQLLLNRDKQRDLTLELGLHSDEQATAILAIMQETNLKPGEAMAIAKVRHSDLFQGNEQRGFQAGQHASLRPGGGGSPPKVETLREKSDKVKQIVDPVRRNREEQRLHGQILARHLGWPRQN